ncbi:hypothetical protein ACF0H5_019125 [Mactra antiquata]
MRVKQIIKLVICGLFYTSLTVSVCDGLFDWLFGKSTDENDRIVKTSGLKFEVQTADDKFLMLKDVIENLSQLDQCNHIVVSKLRKKCGELSEEDLGKLSVQLFNCQSETENRPTYECTDHMSLAECTEKMDSTTWNGYQIVNNRARSLCYATQQQQFRKLAEVTVNQLMSQAHGQLQYLQQLQEGQEQLHAITSETVRDLYQSQLDLIGNQQTLKIAQDTVLSQIHSNMNDLKHEKAMIATGNKELADLTENIKSKLDEATSQLKRQEEVQHESHDRIVSDLNVIQKKSHDALNKLDESADQFVQNHREMLQYYNIMYENMKKMNLTVTHLLDTVNMMQLHLDERINWFSTLLHMADDKLSLLTCGVLHVSYFLFAALAVSFLQSPPVTRVVLFVLVSLNATMEIQCGYSLDFVSISIFLFIVGSVNWLFVWWRNRCKVHTPSEPQSFYGSLSAPGTDTQSDNEEENQYPDTTTNTGTQPDVPLSPIELRQLTSTLGRLYNSLNESGLKGKDNSSTPRTHHTAFTEPKPSTSSAFTPYRRTEQVRADSTNNTRDDVAKVRRYLEQLDENTEVDDIETSDINTSTPRYRHSTPQRTSSRASTSTNRSLCQGFTKSGIPCRLGCVSGSEYCHRHRGQGSS